MALNILWESNVKWMVDPFWAFLVFMFWWLWHSWFAFSWVDDNFIINVQRSEEFDCSERKRIYSNPFKQFQLLTVLIFDSSQFCASCDFLNINIINITGIDIDSRIWRQFLCISKKKTSYIGCWYLITSNWRPLKINIRIILLQRNSTNITAHCSRNYSLELELIRTK